jgi:hypothetical protein
VIHHARRNATIRGVWVSRGADRAIAMGRVGKGRDESRPYVIDLRRDRLCRIVNRIGK